MVDPPTRLGEMSADRPPSECWSPEASLWRNAAYLSGVANARPAERVEFWCYHDRCYHARDSTRSTIMMLQHAPTPRGRYAPGRAIGTRPSWCLPKRPTRSAFTKARRRVGEAPRAWLFTRVRGSRADAHLPGVRSVSGGGLGWVLPVLHALPDGSWLSQIRPSRAEAQAGASSCVLDTSSGRRKRAATVELCPGHVVRATETGSDS